jgi:peptidoglycan/xylan/chitin deacetylase (PgdA/CDA1 family)
LSDERRRAPSGDSQEAILARRKARREAERRRKSQFRRRRLALLFGLLAVAGGAFAVVSLAGGGGSSSSGGGQGAEAAKASGGPKSAGPPVNGEPQAPTQAPLPILMYHVIADPPADAPLPELYVKPADFNAQMKWLVDNGYSAVTLDQVYKAWFGDGSLPRKPVVVSFDDGYRGQYVYAVPALRKLNWPGVLNLKVDTLEPGGELDQRMVKRMIEAGWEIDAHTIHHLDVSQLSGPRLTLEVAGSRKALQHRFGVPVDFFCYPSGKYGPESVQAVKDAGYKGATTVNPGLASRDQMFTLNRIRINLSDGVDGFAGKLRNPGSGGGGGAA